MRTLYPVRAAKPGLTRLHISHDPTLFEPGSATYVDETLRAALLDLREGGAALVEDFPGLDPIEVPEQPVAVGVPVEAPKPAKGGRPRKE